MELHVHVVLTLGRVSKKVVRHEEQILLGKMAYKLPVIGRFWWWLVHVVAPLLLHILWLPILRASVAVEKNTRKY